MHDVVEAEGGFITLDNETIWTDTGHPISAEVRGARLTLASYRHELAIEKAGMIGRIRELTHYMSVQDRYYRISEQRLIALERMLTNIVGEYVLSTANEALSESKRAKVEDVLKRFTERLQAAERAEVMRLAERRTPE